MINYNFRKEILHKLYFFDKIVYLSSVYLFNQNLMLLLYFSFSIILPLESMLIKF